MTLRRSGHSLVELAMVMAVAAISVAIAAPRLANANARYRADLVAQRIASDLGLARARALSLSVSQPVKFTLASSSYTMTGVLDLRNKTTAYFVDLRQPPFQASLVTVNFGSTTQMNFDMYGKPNNPGTIVISAAGYKRTISVDATTGKATWQ